MKVLSSQQEGSFFRIVLSTVDSTGKLVEAVSHPIKVVSKKLQIRRLLAKQETAVAETPLPPPKRTSADIVTDALTRLEQQQKEHTKLLQQLLFQQQSSHKSKPEDEAEFDSNFRRFLGSFQKIAPEERPNKFRKTISSLSGPEAQVFGEFLTTAMSDSSVCTTSYTPTLEEPSSSPLSSPNHPLNNEQFIGENTFSSDLENGLNEMYFTEIIAEPAMSPSSD